MSKPVDISTLSNIPETMLITVRARAIETQSPTPHIRDPRALEILSRISEQDDSKKSVSPGSRVGVIVRTEFLDNIALKFAREHPNGVIVNLGAGLDARCERLDRASTQWIDIDLPESMEVRRCFFKEDDQYRMIAKSILDFDWMDEIDANAAVLFLSEGVLMYLAPSDIKALFKTLSQRFPGAQMAFDTLSVWMVKHAKIHPDVKKYQAWFKWGIDSAEDVQAMVPGLKILQCEKMMQLHKDRWPVFMKLMRILPFFKNSCTLLHVQFPPKNETETKQ